MSSIKKFVLLFAFFATIRLINIDTHSHFLRDESQDLVRMHQIFKERRVTLVGSISEDRSHVFSSLTYYLLMPFAAATGFDPIGPVLGMVFYGSITALLLYKLSERKSIITAFVLAIWTPLVEISRWAWNPNLLPLWHSLAILMLGRSFLQGVFVGLGIHQHYLSAFSSFWLVLRNMNKNLLVGVIITIMPFVVFDLTRPPGLFVTKIFSYSDGLDTEKKVLNPIRFAESSFFVMKYIFSGSGIWVVGLLLITLLLVWDIKSKRSSLWLALAWLTPIMLIAVSTPQTHYFLPGIAGLWVWLNLKRDGWGKHLAFLTILLLLFSSIPATYKLVHIYRPEGDLRLVREVTNIIKSEVLKDKLVNINLAVLQSSEEDSLGTRYKDNLLVKQVKINNYLDYELIDNLFVLTQKEEQDIRSDPSYQISKFRQGPVTSKWGILGTNWKLYRIDKY